MIATISHKSTAYRINLAAPLDVSIPLKGTEKNVNAWGIALPKIVPHQEGDFVGSVRSGASVNFNNIWFNPHSHCTHTETVGHIRSEWYSINKQLERYFFLAEVVTIAPEKHKNDFVVSKAQLAYALGDKTPEALLIRTLPNTTDKMSRDYSGTNPPYLLEEAAHYLCGKEVVHLLVDLPSVDREKDGGKLLAHNAFWNTAGTPRVHATITEFIFVPNTIADGTYLLNLQPAPFENDAAPSRPVLYRPIS